MAQSRQRRQHRVRERSGQPRARRMQADTRNVRVRRIVIAFLILVGLAGILALSPSDSDGASSGPMIAGGGGR